MKKEENINMEKNKAIEASRHRREKRKSNEYVFEPRDDIEIKEFDFSGSIFFPYADRLNQMDELDEVDFPESSDKDIFTYRVTLEIVPLKPWLPKSLAQYFLQYNGRPYLYGTGYMDSVPMLLDKIEKVGIERKRFRDSGEELIIPPEFEVEIADEEN
jgi:hypothetical protein